MTFQTRGKDSCKLNAAGKTASTRIKLFSANRQIQQQTLNSSMKSWHEADWTTNPKRFLNAAHKKYLLEGIREHIEQWRITLLRSTRFQASMSLTTLNCSGSDSQEAKQHLGGPWTKKTTAGPALSGACPSLSSPGVYLYLFSQSTTGPHETCNQGSSGQQQLVLS